MDEKVDPKVKAFVDEYGELVKKHDFDFAAYPVWVPDGTGGFKTIIQQVPVNTKDQPKKSPFMATE